ncbi:hypothetical protein [Archangium lansingense]|uniref:EamA-like transporter family protein n=1 Tax=Archangium lansingense TaxID=2995310 RepID=A0ABT4A9L2_9BACT|nr:hypothetical protein [Archangium lansinium]MCY1077959.1 hypothetical protein [Archangium lansinium]
MTNHRRDLAIWGYAFGYFACYAPYSALTKALSHGALEGMTRGISGFELLPWSTLASGLGMFLFLTGRGWWQYASTRTFLGLRIPFPGPWTFLSGLCSAAIIATTTLAYTFSGTSIVFMMLLMRGGVLILAPLVDVLSQRRVAWPSWVALGLSFAAVGVATAPGVDARVTTAALVDLGVYLIGYFIRLRFMSRLAKTGEPSAGIRYFAEEQMVATPVLVAVLAVAALIGEGPVLLDIRHGFTELFARGRVLEELLVGVLSQGTGIFGGLILLDHRENSFCVPVNRASSIVAGVVATGLLSVLLGLPGVGTRESVGAALVMGAMLVLSLPAVLQARRAAKRDTQLPGSEAGTGASGR